MSRQLRIRVALSPWMDWIGGWVGPTDGLEALQAIETIFHRCLSCSLATVPTELLVRF
jgi:hypothetical protein